MSDKKENDSGPAAFIDARRRGFLQGAAVAGTAAASGVAVAATQATDVVEEPRAVTNGKGYELTDHVRKYYQRARF